VISAIKTLIAAIRQLLVPFNYLRIRYGSSKFGSKFLYDWGFPGFLTAVTIGCCTLLRIPLEVSGNATATASLSNLLALLIAFYMAALAAVATFGRQDIDQLLRGGGAVLLVLNHKTMKREPKDLSYRQFICFLFGYLSVLALILFLALMCFNMVWPKIEVLASGFTGWRESLPGLEATLFVAFVLGFWQMLVISMLGIYFLTDRVHTINDPQH
jgi:hypothetical protein